MKKKKLLSTVMVSALVAAQMVMPAAAANQTGGTIESNLTSKEAILRVQVPTKLDVAVDEFELARASQIYSDEFTMRNQSNVPVNIKIEGTITLGSTPPSLKASDADVKESTDCWIAAAARIEAGEDGYGVDNPNELTATSANVTNPVVADLKITQEFYLSSGTGDVVNNWLQWDNTNKKFILNGTDVTDESTLVGAKYATATKIGTQPATPAALQTAVDSKTVYVVANNEVKEIIKVGTKNVKLSTISGAVYYEEGTIVDDGFANLPQSADAFWVFSQTTTAASEEDGMAAFRYIGKLGENKTNGWSEADIVKVETVYTIKGVGEDYYTEKANDCIYGFYTAPTEAGFTATTKSYKLTAGKDLPVGFTLGSGSTAATLVSVCPKGLESVDMIKSGLATYSAEDSQLVFPAKTVDIVLGEPATYLPEKNNTACTYVITVNEGGATKTFEFTMTK